jgi:hypothetical protein
MAELSPKTFQNLPEPIQDWLASESVTNRIIEINKKAGIFGAAIQIIPRLIARLVIKDLDPQHFINELHRESGVGLAEAKLITQDIDQFILKPIQIILRDKVGVDINLIYAWEPGAPSKPAAPPPSVEKTPPIETPAVSPPVPEAAPVETPTIVSPPAISDTKPFILHEETAPVKPAESSAPIKSSLTFKIPVTVKPAPPKITHKPMEAAIETPFEESSAKEEVGKTAPPKQRVVHYSNLRSSLNEKLQ